MHTSSAVGGCYIVVARLSVEGPLSNRFDDGWRASAHCNAVTCPRTKIFTNYRIKMEIAHGGKKMRREGAGEHPPFFLHNYWIRVLCPSISRRWQFPTLRDPPLHSAIRVLIKHDNLIFRLIRTKVLPFSFPLVRSSYNRIITRFACAANPTTTIYTKFSKRVRTHD